MPGHHFWVGAGSASVAMNALELKVPPLALALVFALVMWLAAGAAPALALAIPWHPFPAALLVGIGVLFVLAGGYAFRRAGTTVNPTRPQATTAIVASGVYRLSRNPMYVGFLLALGGWAVFLAHALPLAFLPAYVGYMNRFQIAPEERLLSARFGAEYASYAHSVRRWF